MLNIRAREPNAWGLLFKSCRLLSLCQGMFGYLEEGRALMARRMLAILILVLLVNACASIPAGPSVLVLPGAGKCFDQFHNDDLMCRKFVLTQFGAIQRESDFKEKAQQDYDIGYMQCMYSRGHRIPVLGEFISDGEMQLPPPPPDMPAPPQTNGSEPSANP